MLLAEQRATQNAVPHVSFYCPDFERDMSADYGDVQAHMLSAPADTAANDSSKKDSGKKYAPHLSQRQLSASQDSAPVVSLNKDPNTPMASTNAFRLSRAEQKNKVNEFYRYIAVCHEVIAERLEGGKIKLSAPNPDDEALVCAAAYFGYEFKDRRDRFTIVHEVATGRDLEIEVLYTIPFTSARKRMSVIIRDVDKTIRIITKGEQHA